MVIEIGLLPGTVEANINTHYALLALLSAHYQQNQTLKPLEMVDVAMKTVRYSPRSKLEQVLLMTPLVFRLAIHHHLQTLSP